ncbi:DUF559 domain-containing protein [Candidatus Daviesbacteria bacterium]|nr:DUF559 domain-containing protein [Candidatus Daviesbacteria bacterium]
MIAKDHTKQENLIADVLSNLGIRYVQQYNIGQYTVDLFLPELNYVIEADGVYGHFKKGDIKRDFILVSDFGIDKVIHTTENTYADILKRIKEECLELEDS